MDNIIKILKYAEKMTVTRNIHCAMHKKPNCNVYVVFISYNFDILIKNSGKNKLLVILT